MVEAGKAEAVTQPLTAEEQRYEYEKFTDIIFDRLEKVLERRPQNPVRKFVS